MDERERWAMWSVALHILVGVLHGTAHLELGIAPGVWGIVFIGGVMYLSPVLSALLPTRRPAFARPLFLSAMLFSLLYGALYHYILPGPDNIASVPTFGWGLVVLGTTAAYAIVDSFGTVLGWILVRSPPRTPSARIAPSG